MALAGSHDVADEEADKNDGDYEASASDHPSTANVPNVRKASPRGGGILLLRSGISVQES